MMNNNLNTYIIDLDVTEGKKKEYSIIMDDFFQFGKTFKINFELNLFKNQFSFIEKLIYDIALYHMRRLNIDIKNKHVTFWLKSTEYDFDFLHMHTDHDDYELCTTGKQTIKPLFTSLTYFNDNDNPTLLTDVNLEMYNEENFSCSKNKKIAFSFPKVLKQIVFDSGNYFHGESYYNDKKSDRKVLVIAVSDENNSPLYIPYFDDKFFMYWRFFVLKKQINFDLFTPSNKIVTFNSDDHNIMTVVVEDNNLINVNFFKMLLIKKDKSALYNLWKLFEGFKNRNTFILDFSNIILDKKCHPHMRNGLQYWDIVFNNEKNLVCNFDIYMENLFKYYENNESFLLDLTKNEYSIIEKYVFDIAKFYLNRFNFDIDNFFLSFEINSNSKSDIIGVSKPFFHCLCYTKTNLPTIFTNIDKESFKFKIFDNINSIINLSIPHKNKLISFDPAFYHITSSKSIGINIWSKKPDLPIYRSDQTYGETITYEKMFSILSIKKCHDSEKIIKVDKILNSDFFEQILYFKKIDYEFFKTLTNNYFDNYILIPEETKNEVVAYKSSRLKQMHYKII